MLDLIAVVASAVVTYITRVLFLVSERLRPPKRIERYLPLIGPAVLAAIAVPGIVAPRGEVSWVDTVPAIVSALVSWLLWRWIRQMWVGLLVGLLAWWGILAVLVALGVVS